MNTEKCGGRHHYCILHGKTINHPIVLKRKKSPQKDQRLLLIAVHVPQID